MRKKKLLFIMQLPPPVHGASIMNQNVSNSKLINENFDCNVLPLAFESSISSIGKFSVRKIFLMVGFAFSLALRLLRFRPDVVYYTLAPVGYAFYRDAFFVLIIKMFPCKIIYHLHGKGIKKSTRNTIKKKIYRKVFNNTSLIHLGNVLLKDIEDVHRGKQYVLPNGIQTKVLDRSVGQEFGVDRKVRFIYLSNLAETKGIKIFLESLKMLKLSGYSFSAKVVGNSSKSFSIDDAKKFVKDNNLMDEIKVLGSKYDNDKYKELASSDVFVFPTFYANECFPLSILEAMQMRLGIVTADNGAISEMIKTNHEGYVVDRENVQQTFHAMEKFILNPELIQDMGDNAYRKFVNNYSIDIFERNLLKILLEA